MGFCRHDSICRGSITRPSPFAFMICSIRSVESTNQPWSTCRSVLRRAALIGPLQKHPGENAILAPQLPSAIKGLVQPIICDLVDVWVHGTGDISNIAFTPFGLKEPARTHRNGP